MSKSLFRILVTLAFGTFGASAMYAAFPTVALKAISVGELQAPVNISNAGDRSGRLFICDQRGTIRIIQNGMLLPVPFLDITAKVIALNSNYDERGLLGLAFHPDYSNSARPGFGLFYVFYSVPSPNVQGNPTPVNCQSTISEFRVSANPNVADPLSERVVLKYDKPQGNHNGGELVFGPDGFLYISVGDGGGANDNNFGHTGGGSGSPSGVLGNAQDKTKLLGKLLRIDPLGTNRPGLQYGIPADNPFFNFQSGEREEIFAYGLRNPWRASFDDGPSGTNRLFLADVGQDSYEEINIISLGGNYGWRVMEGTFFFDASTPYGGGALIPPIAQYAHPGILTGPPQLGRSIIGGYLYRGSAIPALVGKYICGDYNAGAINSGTTLGSLIGIEELTPGGAWTVPVALNIVGGNPFATHLLALGRDDAGELYIATEGIQGPQNNFPTGQPTGGIYQIVPDTYVPTWRESWLLQYFPFLQFVPDAADPDGDNISNLLEYAFALNPLVANPPGAGFQITTAPSSPNTVMTISFRRDPRATDLTYTLQTSSDLVTWTTIAQSVGGAVASGSGLPSESDVANNFPIKLVVTQETIAPAQGQRFARLQVTH